MSQREDILKFETGRIKALQEERLHIQKKTFTKWMNSFLSKVRLEVDDLFVDLADGKKLLRLLEIISGEKLGKPNNGKMRFHKIENVNRSLAFLCTKVRLESIGAEDIVDGNPRLILGLIWTIILRFQIQEIEIDVDEENESSEKRSAKDALLLWCQRKTSGYDGVNIQDFSGSWRNGLGFNALIHSHRPDLILFDTLLPHQHIENLNNAFDAAHRKLGIAKLLDAEDIDVNKPDEKSVMTYVASYYHTFAKMKTEMKGGRRIANIVSQMMDIDHQKADYERLLTILLDWIKQKIIQLEDHHFPNSLDSIQKQLLQFKTYRTEEKPPKYRERSEIEAKLFSIQTKLKALGQAVYIPPDGKLVQDLERAWNQLEKAEHRRELALRDELMRQERLEQLAYKFEKKSVLREGYLKEMIQVLSDPRYGSNFAQIEATVKKHEAISADILARTERIHDLKSMAAELLKENYHGSEGVQAREKTIVSKWKELLALLENHKQLLNNHNKLMSIMREMGTVSAQIKSMEDKFSSDDFGKHLLAVEDLLQTHNLLESQIVIQGEAIARLSRQSEEFANHKEAPLLKNHLKQLNDEYESLKQLSIHRRMKLEESRMFLQFLEDHEEEEAWVTEKQRICSTAVAGKDLLAILSLQQKHKALKDEMKARYPKSEQLCKMGESLVDQPHQELLEIRNRINGLRTKWKELIELSKNRTQKLEGATETFQYFADANEADSWMNEKLSLLSSKDYGKDEPSAQSLLQRLGRLESEVKSYEGDLQRLNEQAHKLIESGISSFQLSETSPTKLENDNAEHVIFVPEEIEVEQTVERDVTKEVMEMRRIPQVRSLFPFSGQGMEMEKGEVLILLNKTNYDWWNVRKSDNANQDGFVPANYLREIEPKTVYRPVKRTVKVPETQRVKKTIMKRQVVRKTKDSVPSPLTLANEADLNVEQRQSRINNTYNELLQLSKARRHYLEDAIKLFGFYRECTDFENWMKEKEKMLTTEEQTDGVEQLKRLFENFLTDLSSSSYRIEAIDVAVAEFIKNGHSQLEGILQRQAELHERWDNLNRLKFKKEKSLEGASSVELFNRTCEEAHDWMVEKMHKMDNDELGKDMKTVQALQRKHKNIERELAPVEEKFNRVNLLANSVKTTYPNEKQRVNAKQKDLHKLWNEVKDKAIKRRGRLEEAVGHQIFDSTIKNLRLWLAQGKEKLSNDELVKDVATAENVLKEHNDLGDDISGHADEFNELQKLGEVLARNDPTISGKLQMLQEDYESLIQVWKKKEAWLQQNLNLQLFNRDADQIDATSSSHETFLEFDDLGSSADDVLALLKRHEDFENTLIVQDERIKNLADTAHRLLALPHFAHPHIKNRLSQVVTRRKAIKDEAMHRKQNLLASQAFYEFQANADEKLSWINDKSKVACDESYRDLNNLQRKLKKHEAFEGELKANERRLGNINRTGQSLMSGGHYRSPEIKTTLKELNGQWENLWVRTNDKGRKLRQATAQHTYNRGVDDAKAKLSEMEVAVKSDDLGNDLRSTKQLLKKHQVLETDMNTWNNKIVEVVRLGEDMIKDGHFDASTISGQTEQLKDRFRQLQDPFAKRRQQLEESLKLYQFNFEIDGELQWIQDHVPAASSSDLGQNLVDAQNLLKKHMKLERELLGHHPVIEKLLSRGASVANIPQYAKSFVHTKCQELTSAWDNLSDLARDRKRRLELSLKAHQFFSEVNEVESWMNEKTDLLMNSDYGRDEDATVKLLTKHKTLELEMDSYSGLIREMGHQAAAMIESKHPDSKLVEKKQTQVNQLMKNLQKLASLRRKKLIESKHRHEYFRESTELEIWIDEQMQTATSEEYGQDYEHLLLLQNKFDVFKHHIIASSEQFEQCRKMVEKLRLNENSYADEIEKKQDDLKDVWTSLLEYINIRDQKLQAAGEIHRFNRDVADALQRIQEKYSSIPDDLGRDLNSVLNLLRKHEGFENDLVAIEAQLQVLVDDSVRLQTAYPGGNADHILTQQTIMVDHWSALQERSMQRKEELKNSCDFQRFLASVRDLISWASLLQNNMLAEERVRDAASAQMLKTDHDRLKAEIEAREESFAAVVQNGEYMIRNGHYAKDEIRVKLDQLLDVRQKLHATWQHKKVYLDQLIDLHFFLRDAKQLDTISAAQEAYLSSDDYATIVEDVENQIRKHEAFEKLLTAQEEKLSSLQGHGSKLLKQNHFDGLNIKQRLEEVTGRRRRVNEMCSFQKQKLTDALLCAQFNRDVVEAEIWIEDKQKKLNAEMEIGDPIELEDKIKRLQKHQAFQSELSAHSGRIEDIKDKGNKLLAKCHDSSPSIRRQLESLLVQWNKLLSDSNNRGRGLEEAQDILLFSNQADKIEAWIRDKEMMVQAGDSGRDYEHCLSLQRKLDDVDSDMQVDETRIKEINSLADKLICQGRSATQNIKLRKDEVNQKLKNLQGALQDYRERLAGALEIHAFNRDVDDTNDRINEKTLAMSIDDYGKNLLAVEALQRKQETIERDLTVIETKLKENDVEARRLIQKHADAAAPIRAKLSRVQESWRNLNNCCHTRKQLLANSYTLQKFMAELKELEVWVNDMNERMNSADLPKEVAEAENALLLHEERKAEIDGRQDAFKALKDFGYRLLQQNHNSKDILESSLLQLEELRRTLIHAWEERTQTLTQCLDLQLFYEQAVQAHAWLASKEALLNNDDLGDSMSSVEALIRKHEGFEKTIEAQSSKIDQLEKFATELIAGKHYATTDIQSHLQDVCQRRDRLKELAMVRRRKLHESKQLQQFIRNNYEVLGWIHEKLSIASDENYRDSSNLQRKIQKHEVFEAELMANKSRVNNIQNQGERLIGASHFAGMEIQTQLDELESRWRQLLDTSQLKKERLTDAYQALIFNQTLDDLDAWLDEVEAQLQSEAHGKDLASTQNLLKKHQALEMDVNNHLDKFETIKDATSQFVNSNHFMSIELQERADGVVHRYRVLHEPVQIRRDNLEEALLLHQFQRDVDDELSWIGEKDSLASSTDLGNSLTAVQNLQKKHQMLEAEIEAHDPLIQTVLGTGQQMIRNIHYASARVEQLIQQLQTQLQQLKDQTTVRRLRLADAVESQMFYSEANEMEIWMTDRLLLLTSQDIGKDEETVQIMMKKVDALERDVETLNSSVIKLNSLKTRLIERGHFDSKNIELKQLQVETRYCEMKEALTVRRKNLNDNKKLFKYLREVDDVVDKLNEQMAVATLEDYGRDVEHIEILINKFENFTHDLSTSEEQVELMRSQGLGLIEENVPEAVRIKRKIEDLLHLWEYLKEQVHLRRDALAGAKQVHLLDRNADETIGWIQEKDSLLLSEDYGHDLESIQSLVRRHEGFERDLAAIKERVENVVQEAHHLAEIFPDARNHVGTRHEETVEAWNRLLDKSAQRKDKLSQAEELQAYFEEYRELIAWLNEMTAKITSPGLAQDVRGAESLLARHQEYHVEIDSRQDAFVNFHSAAKPLISHGHFMADEIEEKVCHLDKNWKMLLATWKDRQNLYEQNLDTQVFKRNADVLDSWMQGRVIMLSVNDLGESISQVEELLRKHEDFEKTIEAQEEKLSALKRVTMLEKAFKAQKLKEVEQRKAEDERHEQERLHAIKRREHERILDERKKEDDRRWTADIGFSQDPESPHIQSKSGNLAKYPSVESISLSPGTPIKKLSAVEMPEIKPSEGLQKLGGRVPSRENLQLNWTNKSDASGIKRSESMKLDDQQKKVKRTSSFNTRRRAQSFRKSKHTFEAASSLPPVEIEGFMERKQELQSGGKRATIRSWKTLYSVLCGQLLCFFKDKDDFIDNKAAAPPLSIHKSVCSIATDYTKKKHVLRLQLIDGAEYLFMADTIDVMTEWINKLNFHANLPPRMQLLSYAAGESGRIETGQHRLSSQTRVREPQQPIYENFPLDQSLLSEGERQALASDDSVVQMTEDSTDSVRMRRKDTETSDGPPPLPVSLPPVSSTFGHSFDWSDEVNHLVQDWSGKPLSISEEDVHSSHSQESDLMARHRSLPVGVTLATHGGPSQHSHDHTDRSHSVLGSEDEYGVTGERKTKKGVFQRFFKKN